MYIIWALGIRALRSSRAPMEHDVQPLGGAHPTLETTGIFHFFNKLLLTHRPANLGSNGKHANHRTNEGDLIEAKLINYAVL
jgi:hypothetical protein